LYRIHHRANRATLGHLGKRVDDRIVGNVATCTGQVLQRIEIRPPFIGDGIRIVEIVLVKFLDERRIAAEQLRAFKKLFHHGRPPGLSLDF
jgi:hypothetical protein